MSFENEKKNFLTKLDKSKKGSVDDKIRPLLEIINAHPCYYTTSSCSGRVYLWRGSGKKNETEWIKMSHNPITEDFLTPPPSKGVVWLRLEPVIIHVCAKDLESANILLQAVRPVYKKSSLLSINHKIMVEIRGSEFLEMPFSREGKLLFQGEMGWLVMLINQKMKRMSEGIAKLGSSPSLL